MLTRKALILAKKESTYGSDPTPTLAANAMIVMEPEITPEIDANERKDVGISLSRLKEIGGKRRVKVTFTTELRGSGAAGTAPEGIGALLQACGMSEAISAGVSVTYAFLSATWPSVTLWIYLDGIQHIVVGCVGDWELNVVAGEIPKIKWTFMGIYATPTDVSFPTSYAPDSTVPVAAKNLTTTFDSYAAVIHELNLKSNNVVTERPNLAAATGIAGYQITDRNPEGEIIVESVVLATKNWLTKFEADTVNILSTVIGSVAGNICTITANQCRVRQLPYKDVDGILTQPIAFQLARSVANDELSIVFT